jgi:glycosyltransferase involved in cell wall biosynthesis
MSAAERSAGLRKPLVSVLIPVYNGEAHLGEAIESVLSQDYPRIEVIVIDDASADRSAEIARAYDGVRVIERPVNGMVARARNDGLAEASGEFVALLDHDDLMTEVRIPVQAGHLIEHPETDVVLGMEQVFVEEGGKINTGVSAPRPNASPGEEAVIAYHPPTLMARTAVLRRFGFDEGVDFADDLDLCLRLMEDPEVGVERMQTVVTLRRFHPNNITRDEQRARIAFARAVKRRIERKRAAAATES